MANRFWVGGTASWDGTASTKWATTSGGAGGASAPGLTDDVFFDGNSGSGTVTTTSGSCQSLTCTGFPGTMAGVPGGLTIAGNVTMASGMTATGLAFNVGGGAAPSITCNFTSAGCTVGTASFNFGNPLTVNLQDDLSAATRVAIGSGTFNTNNHNVTAPSIQGSGSITRTINMGSGTWTVTGTGANAWFFGTTSGLTLNPGTSTIKLTANSSSGTTFDGGGLTYNNIWNASAGSGALTIVGSNTFNDFRSDAGRTIRFTDSTTTTVSSLNLNGTVGNLITLACTISGSWTISDSTGTNTVTLCSISRSVATGGASFVAINSVNGGNNVGWIFPNAGNYSYIV